MAADDTGLNVAPDTIGEVTAAWLDKLASSTSNSMIKDPVFAVKATTGGALVFYTTAAQLTLTPPDGGTISALTIPGCYSPSSSSGLTSATVGYVEQFATYIPAAGNGDRQVVADIAPCSA